MSCSVCRLPFVPHPVLSHNPLREHLPPPGLLTASEIKYFDSGMTLGLKTVMGIFQKCDYFSSNMFGIPMIHNDHGTPILFTMMWETPYRSDGTMGENGTVQCMHKTCAALLRRIFEAEDSSNESLSRMITIEAALGRPQGDDESGRLMHVEYENIEPMRALRKFWHAGDALGSNWFDWKACNASEHAWVLKRPDTFPRFFPTVDPSRLLGTMNIADAGPRTDAITTLPSDILQCVFPYLDLPSYIALTSTCRFMRHQALTTWQSHARKFVLSLRWATPTKAELEEVTAANREKLASEENSPHDGDWLLYLRHVHCTKSMRVRKWIWQLCEEIKDTVEWMKKEKGLDEEKVRQDVEEQLDRALQVMQQGIESGKRSKGKGKGKERTRK